MEKSFVRAFQSWSAALAAVLLVSNVAAQQVNRNGQAFPSVSCPGIAKGAAIPNSLGGKLGEVAGWYGHSEKEFRALCARDRNLRSDRLGRLHYVCEGAVPTRASNATIPFNSAPWTPS